MNKWKQCKKKKRYRTEMEASKAFKAVSRAYPDKFVGEIHVYDCSFCDGWHIGHNNPPKSCYVGTEMALMGSAV